MNPAAKIKELSTELVSLWDVILAGVYDEQLSPNLVKEGLPTTLKLRRASIQKRFSSSRKIQSTMQPGEHKQQHDRAL
ncbi:MAG: hypothetical protein ACM3ND_15445 [Acidobacteriota bacterium]